MMNFRKISVGTYLLFVAFLLLSAAFVMHFLTFSAFNYQADKWVIALSAIALWSVAFLLFERLFGYRFFAADVFFPIAAFATVLALLKFLIPCLSPIGIYFTVHNMGDVEANAIGVPRSIVTIVLYLVGAVLLLVSAFLNRSKDGE